MRSLRQALELIAWFLPAILGNFTGMPLDTWGITVFLAGAAFSSSSWSGRTTPGLLMTLALSLVGFASLQSLFGHRLVWPGSGLALWFLSFFFLSGVRGLGWGVLKLTLALSGCGLLLGLWPLGFSSGWSALVMLATGVLLHLAMQRKHPLAPSAILLAFAGWVYLGATGLMVSGYGAIIQATAWGDLPSQGWLLSTSVAALGFALSLAVLSGFLQEKPAISALLRLLAVVAVVLPLPLAALWLPALWLSHAPPPPLPPPQVARKPIE